MCVYFEEYYTTHTRREGVNVIFRPYGRKIAVKGSYLPSVN